MNAPLDPLALWREAVIRHTPRARNFSEALYANRPMLSRIWRTYTQERGGLGRLPATNAGFVAPYLLGFHPGNVARIHGIFRRAKERGLALPALPVRLIDFGCGTGAATQGFLRTFGKDLGGRRLSIELFDRSRHLLGCAKEMLAELAPDTHIRGMAAALEDVPLESLAGKWRAAGPALNVFLFGYVWNEVRRNRKTESRLGSFLAAALRQRDPAWLMLCEPATEAGAREAMAVRDGWVADGWAAAYPCPQSVQCPMTRDPARRDWCYSEFENPRSRETDAVERALKVSRRTLGASGYLFLNSAAAAGLPGGKRDPAPPVVVGHPQVGAGKRELLLCLGDELDRKPAGGAHAQFTLRGSVFSR